MLFFPFISVQDQSWSYKLNSTDDVDEFLASSEYVKDCSRT